MLKPQLWELRMAETMCDPILSCPRYKNLAYSRLAHDQRRRETNEWRWKKRRDGAMQDENQHAARRAAPSQAGPETTRPAVEL